MSRTVLFEIGCEELPTSFIRAGLEQLPRYASEALTKLGIQHGSVRALGTPRRLAIVVMDVAEDVAARVEELLGPAESAARGADGAWTKAAEGFARKNEVALSDLSIVETPKGRYLRAQKTLPGSKTIDRLGDVLATVAARISFPKSMRWADIETPFGRPVQWVVALFGADVVRMSFVRHDAGRTTRGHRFLASAPVVLESADTYVETLRAAHVLVDVEERRKAQQSALEAAATVEGGTLVPNAFLEGEVLGLVEEPFAVVGHFDSAFLTLPDEVVETVMSHHQRYFAIRNKAGRLMPAFITVANTALDPATIRKGNETTMRGRLSDARFFVDHDRAETLESRVPKLAGVVYHQKLGSYGDKVARLEKLAGWLAPRFGADAALTSRAAKLSKADLVALAVGEFPELQGIMGRDYARNDKEPEAVAAAIAEHYLPKSAEDSVAETNVGAALAVADRLDTIVGFFAIGQKPTGGGDPFGLRRAALGILRTLFQFRVRLSLAEAIAQSYKLYTLELGKSVEDTTREVMDFVRERLEGVLVQKHSLDTVRACLAAGSGDPVDVAERVEALSSVRGSSEFAKVVTAFERVFNISRGAPAGEPDGAKLTTAAEQALFQAFTESRAALEGMIAQRDFKGALRLVAEVFPDTVDRFFTEVFVMDDKNPDLRDARLRLLGRIADDVGRIARFDTL